MFTGIVQAVGKLSLHGKRLSVEGYPFLFQINIGDSIAVDGVCLTVAAFRNKGFLADVSEETLRKTTLGEKAATNSKVNLEPALRLSDRLGGHLVSGHIDGLGRVHSIKELPNSWIVGISFEDKSFGKYICEKASVTVDGISLTVAQSSENGMLFYIAVIPHTWENTSLKYLQKEKLVNLEIDIMAKYAEKLLLFKDKEYKDTAHEAISKNWLAQNGWE